MRQWGRFILVTLFFLLLTIGIGAAQTAKWSWLKTAAGDGGGIPYSIAVDKAGNCYITGYYTGSFLQFDTTTILSKGSYDMFIAKYNRYGKLIWAKGAGGPGYDWAYSVAVDGKGNSFVTGWFSGPTIFFDTLSLKLTKIGASDTFIAKYDLNGNVVWATNFSDSSTDAGFAIAADEGGNCYVTGTYWGVIRLKNGSLVSKGENDIFLIKFNSDGEALWAKSAGGPDGENGFAVSLDNAGHCFLTGQTLGAFFGSSITFDSITVATNRSSFFVASYDEGGNAIWAKTASGDGGDDVGKSIAADMYGNCYVTGYFSSDTITFDNVSAIRDDWRDMFAVKYDRDGNAIWARAAGGGLFDQGGSIAVDDEGSCYLTGLFDSPAIRFDSTLLINQGSYDLYLTKYNSNGIVVWAKQVGGTGWDQGMGVATDRMGNVYVTGYSTSPSLDFDSIAFRTANSADIVLAKMEQSPVETVDVEQQPNNYELNQNFPNPFNAITTIKFHVPISGAVTLDIFDQMGRKVTTLLKEWKFAGTYQVKWEAVNVSSGVYYCRMSSGLFTRTKKLLYLQ